MVRLMPRQQVPDLQVRKVDGEVWQLSDQKDCKLTLIIVYRGLHCPICSSQLKEIDARVSQLREKGVEPIAISTDTEKRARIAQEQWEIKSLPIGYGLTIDKAREWGLYISNAIREQEPDQFAEPGFFLVKPDQTLFGMVLSTMPFTRPPIDDLLSRLDFILEHDYPGRGEA